MLTIDRQPTLPELPQFRREMEAFLTTAAENRTVRPTRRVRGYAVAAAATAAAVIAAIVGVALTHGSGSNPSRNPSPGPVQLASFSVSTTSGGLVTLTLTPGQLRDPDALRQALAKVGVPALVTADKVCYQPGPTSILTQVLSAPQHQPDGSSVWTITPSALPSNDELSIGYFHVQGGFGIHVTVVPEHTTLTCTAGPPSPPHP